MKESLEGELQIYQQESGWCASDIRIDDESFAEWVEETIMGDFRRYGKSLGRFRITVERIE